MPNITNDILGSLKLRHLDTQERWVWVALNLLNVDGNGFICRLNGENFSLLELSELIMLDSVRLKVSLEILEEKGFVLLMENNKLKLLLTPEEERNNRKRISAKLRKRKQRQKLAEKVNGDA